MLSARLVRAVRVGEFCSCLGLVVGLEMEMVAVVVVVIVVIGTRH